MSVCFYNSLPDDEYPDVLIIAGCSSSPFCSKISSSVKNSYLPTFPNHIVNILAVCLSSLYCTLFCLIFLLIVLISH